MTTSPNPLVLTGSSAATFLAGWCAALLALALALGAHFFLKRLQGLPTFCVAGGA